MSMLEQNHTERRYIIGIFDDEGDLLKAIRNIRQQGVTIKDVMTPFPIHGMEDALGMRWTRIPVGAFIVGFIAAVSTLLLMSWMVGINWPINFGGKPFIPLPSFVPIVFEATVLTTAFALVIALFYYSYLKPTTHQHPVDLRITDDKFAILIEAGEEKNKVVHLLKEYGATEVNEKILQL